MQSIKQLLLSAKNELSLTSNTPYLDAEVILAHVLQLDKVDLISKSEDPVSHDKIEIFSELIKRRKFYHPVAYLTGVKEFFGLEFEVNPSVLIPRPETELLVETALIESNKLSEPVSILDLGTGSGCIAVAIAYHLRKAGKSFHLTAVDQSAQALALAEVNVKKFSLQKEITLLQSDWFSALDENKDRFNLIVSNPPYIACNDQNVSPETLSEPHSALYSGNFGLDDIEVLIKNSAKFIKSRGCLLCEIGSTQRQSIIDIVTQSVPRAELDFKQDLAKLDRLFKLAF